MSEERIRIERDEGVLTLELNRPEKKNAFDDPQWDGLAAALRAANEDDETAVVVITGAGGNFSAGQDLGAFGGSAEPRADGQQSGYYGCMEAVVEFEKPLVAAARGVGVGIGATLLLHCDLVYVAENVRLRLPFVNLGLVPEAASSYLLQQAAGPRLAAELFFTAEWIDGARAVEAGIATRSVPEEAVLDVALAKAREIARFPVGSLRETKRTLKVAHAAAIRAALDAENAGMKVQAGSPENIEAIQAFLQKRAPDFRSLARKG
ncbi:MAG: enoyl-CoA hydratase-related protein [Myxococcota bacterium]|nr:enoyl-CoA hydratase-related protein [Myxococcota bacterium]